MLTPGSDVHDRKEALNQLRAAEDGGNKDALLYNIIIDVFDTEDIEDLMSISELAHKFSKDDMGIMTLKLGDTMMRSDDLENHQMMAYKLYRYSSEYDKTEALRKAGYMLEYGMGVERSWKDALALYQKAADLGDPQANMMLKDLKSKMDSDYMIIE